MLLRIPVSHPPPYPAGAEAVDASHRTGRRGPVSTRCIADRGRFGPDEAAANKLTLRNRSLQSVGLTRRSGPAGRAGGESVEGWVVVRGLWAGGSEEEDHEKIRTT